MSRHDSKLLPSLTRRIFVGGAVVLASPIQPFAASLHQDPLLNLICCYRHGLQEFNRIVTTLKDDDAVNRLAEETFQLHLTALDTWDGPATSREGAIEALRISITDKDGGVYGSDAADNMVRAALRYLEAI